jgi:hypothetical protein
VCPYLKQYFTIPPITQFVIDIGMSMVSFPSQYVLLMISQDPSTLHPTQDPAKVKNMQPAQES